MTGREGQVARSLAERAQADGRFQIVPVGRPELDLTRPETVTPALVAARPDLVVSAAAFTAVDQAEDEPALAFAVNADGAAAVARAAAAIGVPVVHLSTDYVFDGAKEGPYTEEDAPAPRSVYGSSKLAGEGKVAGANPRHIILRTAWVYSPFGRNFVRTMLRLAAEREEISVVADQWGNPTSAFDISDAILKVAESLCAAGSPPESGVYHLTGSGATNWAGFARHILAASRRYGGPHARVRDIAASDYPAKALRPVNSRLSTQKLARVLGWTPPPWEQSAQAVVARLVGQDGEGERL